MSRKMAFLFFSIFSIPFSSRLDPRGEGRRRGGGHEIRRVNFLPCNTQHESRGWFNIVLMNFLSAPSDWPVVPTERARPRRRNSLSLSHPVVVGIRRRTAAHIERRMLASFQFNAFSYHVCVCVCGSYAIKRNRIILTVQSCQPASQPFFFGFGDY